MGKTIRNNDAIIFRNNAVIILILIIAFAERILVAKQFGITYNLGSDDLSYVNSAIALVETGQITMHGVLSAQVMPGMALLLAPLALIFGKGHMLWIAMKCLWMIMGLFSIYGVYRIGLLLDIARENNASGRLPEAAGITPGRTAATARGFTPGRVAGTIAAALMLAVDFAWMDNLILTETPYMFFSVYLVYFSLRLGHESGARPADYTGGIAGKGSITKYFWGIVICFAGALFIRPTIAMFPLFLVIYLLIRQYDRKLLIRQLLLAACVLLLALAPWTIRNYIQFGHFIPLTYGMGNPMLLGTYQGEGYPADEDIDYDREVKAKLPGDMDAFAKKAPGISPSISPSMLQYYMLQYDGYKAKYRMKLWWENDPKSMLKSYLWIKPKIIMANSFLWEETLGTDREDIRRFRHLQWIVSCISFIYIIFASQRYGKRGRNETDAPLWREINHNTVFLATVCLSQVYLYAYSFAFERYGQTLLFFQFVMIGWAFGILLYEATRVSKW